MERGDFLRKFILIFLAVFLFSGAPRALAASYPSDPDSSKQWYLNKIRAYDAWSLSKGSQDVVVAVLDTGIDIDHPDLQLNLWTNSAEVPDSKDNDGNVYVDDVNGWDFVDGDSDPRPDLNDLKGTSAAINHGTLVAGIIGAMGDNAVGISGLNWRVKIMPLRVLDSQGQGDVNAVEEAIRYAVDKGADIINLSFIGPGFDKKLFLTLRDAYQKGILVVAAVGNQAYEGIDLDQTPLYPVCYSGTEGEDVVLGVAAVDKNDLKPVFSNYGKNCVDIVAPGVDMYGTVVHKSGQGYSQSYSGGWQGTSLAAPVVTGTAALIKSIKPSYGAREIRDILLASADSVSDNLQGKLGRGRVNALRALELAVKGIVSGGGSTGINYLTIAAISKATSDVRLMRTDGSVVKSFKAYDDGFRGGVRVSSADVDGDGVGEVVTGAGQGGGPHIRVFSAEGTPRSGFFAYDKNFRGGVNLAVGDLDGDGKAEIITAPLGAMGPEIKIFRGNGKFISSFFAYDKNFRGGVSLATGDLDGDGKVEIIVAPGPGGDSRVRVFNLAGINLLNFQAYPAGTRSGVSIAYGDIDGDSRGDFVVSLMKGGLPEVRIFDTDGSWRRAFMASGEKNKSGLAVTLGDVDRDGVLDVVTAAGSLSSSKQVAIFDGYGRRKFEFSPFDKNFAGGVSVGVIKL
ncbi:MAG: S8 family serine peptidase [Patescibacteria group bacterium]